jgi:hypothetical protein
LGGEDDLLDVAGSSPPRWTLPCLVQKFLRTDAYKQSRNDRRKVEMLCAHLRRILTLDRLRLRGPNGARDEFLLAAIAQNLRRMAKRLVFEMTEAAPIAA